MKKNDGRTKNIFLAVSVVNFVLILILLYLTQCNGQEVKPVVGEDSSVSLTGKDAYAPYAEQSQREAFDSFQELNRTLLEENAGLQQRLEDLSITRERAEKIYIDELKTRHAGEVTEVTDLPKKKLNDEVKTEFSETAVAFKYSDAELKEFSVFFPGKRWDKKELKVYFKKRWDVKFNEDILKIANEWSRFSGIEFKLTPRRFESDIRVSRGRLNYIYSKIGNEAEEEESYGKITMSLSHLKELSKRRQRQIILHEFGHALGLGHAHQTQKSSIVWDTLKAIQYYKEKYNLDSAQTMKQVIIPHQSGRHFPLDTISIMAYEVPVYITKNGVSISWPDSISPHDAEMVSKMYQNN